MTFCSSHANQLFAHIALKLKRFVNIVQRLMKEFKIGIKMQSLIYLKCFGHKNLTDLFPAAPQRPDYRLIRCPPHPFRPPCSWPSTDQPTDCSGSTPSRRPRDSGPNELWIPNHGRNISFLKF